MLLSPSEKSLIENCGKAIASGVCQQMDLSSLNDAFRRDVTGLVAELAHSVEEFTGGERTVRRSDSTLFKRRVKGVNLYLVVCACALSIPRDETVSVLSSNMKLLSFGPYASGLNFPADAAL